MDLGNIREKIDEIDTELVRLFARRMELSSQVAKYKIENGVPVLSQKREDEIVLKNRSLEPKWADYTEKLYREIFELSREHQIELMKQKGEEK